MGKFSYPLNLVNRKYCVFRLEADEGTKKAYKFCLNFSLTPVKHIGLVD